MGKLIEAIVLNISPIIPSFENKIYHEEENIFDILHIREKNSLYCKCYILDLQAHPNSISYGDLTPRNYEKLEQNISINSSKGMPRSLQELRRVH